MWLGLDVGGTKLAAGVFDSTGEPRATGRIPVDPSLDGDGLFDALAELADELIATAARKGYAGAVTGVGIGCGGPMDWAAGEVSPLNLPVWRDFPLRQRVSDVWRGVPVRLINDAMAMAAGEHWRGAGVGSRSMLGVVVSTGVGGGLVLGGRILTGDTGNAGHLGHVVVDPTGPDCACGGRGCLEAIARGPAVVAWALEAGWVPPTDAAATGADLVASARSGDVIAAAAISRAGQAFGIALASTSHLLDLDRVVVGGGFAAGAGDLLLGPAVTAYRRHAGLAYARRTAIVPAAAGHDAGVVGAAALVVTDSYWPAGGTA